MKETKNENLLAGLTAEARAGETSSPVMKDGNEPQDMLLALLNNALSSMINSQQAKILGTVMTKKGVGTLVLVYGVKPETANSLKMVVGNE